jgi:hypothetical protein
MSDKIFIKLVVVFGVLAVLLIFLGVNYVPRISALSSANENVVDVANYAGSDWIERHPSTVAKPVNYTGAEVTGADMKVAPVFDVTGAVVSDPAGTMLNASQSGASAVPMTGTDMKIAPVFDVTDAVVSDPTGTVLNASQSGDLAIRLTGTDMKIASVFDNTGAVVSDPTGTMLSLINP